MQKLLQKEADIASQSVKMPKFAYMNDWKHNADIYSLKNKNTAATSMLKLIIEPKLSDKTKS